MKVLFVFILLIVAVGNSFAAIIQVPKDYAKIQDAINATNPGDEVVISPGNYELDEYLYIHHAITLRSTFDGSDWNVVKNTVLKYREGYCYIAIAGTYLTRNTVIRGLTLTRDPYYPVPNDVLMRKGIDSEGESATIEYNIIENCVNVAYPTFQTVGGAICSVNGVIQNNIIRNNRADSDSAMYNCGGIIRNNLIYNDNGANLHISTSSPVEFYNNTVSSSGHALFSLTPGAKLYNNIFWSGDAKFSISPSEDNAPRNCVIKGFTGPGVNIITADPKFVDPSKGDFRLQASSPCIDAGLTTATIKADIIGVQRGLKGISGANDGATDIGAYEYKPKPVSVWLPNGGPDSVSAGDDLKVAWEMELPTAGTAILLQLFNGEYKVADLGAFWNAAGADESTVKLPRNIPPRASYTIRGVSSWNQTLYANTPYMSIASNFTGIPGGLWVVYH